MTMQCCPLDGGDGERPEFYDQNQVNARKPHTCYECGDAIAVGARHEVVTGKWHGDRPSTYRTCLSCVEIRDHFACGGGWLFGQVWEQLEENFFPGMKAGGPCMEGLSPEAKARLFEKRLAWMEGA